MPNSAAFSPARERKSATLEGFITIWERDYLALSKRSTQSAVRSQMKALKAAFGKRDMRQIGAGDLQRLIAKMQKDGYEPKTIRNMWSTVRLIWTAAHAQGYVDAVLPKPKLPRLRRKKPKFFSLAEVASMIAASKGEHKVFLWLAAETGLRSGELAGIKLTDVDGDRLTVNQSVWHGKAQTPKTDNAVRTLALSPELVTLIWEQIVRQKAKRLEKLKWQKKGLENKEHEFLFTSADATPLDMNLFRKRHFHPESSALEWMLLSAIKLSTFLRKQSRALARLWDRLPRKPSLELPLLLTSVMKAAVC